ncbi:MAG: dynamin family protein [Burkholderiaceae bacterium]
MGVLGEQISDLGSWQDELTGAVRHFEQWIDAAELADDATAAHINRVYDRLGRRRLSIAFVAEFSRGKSELINALFFSGHGQRIVPSSAGRTTMCPTELEWDGGREPSIALLPIESRLEDTPVSELRGDLSKWQVIPFDPDDADSLKQAFTAVCETTEVSEEQAAALGFGMEDQDQIDIGSDGNVIIPKWRHAVVNLPHPMLQAGLTIIDTPGLNAIGSEPELTLNTIPNAEAVLFLLSADAGVTRSDIEVWREHICPSQSSGRFVVLNKIDGLWDELKDEEQINQEIDSQVAKVAQTLGLSPERVIPVSAQKGLVARARNDADLLERSRLKALELKLTEELIPQRREILQEHVGREFTALANEVGGVLKARHQGYLEQLEELNGLRGKNRSVMVEMGEKIHREREDFDDSLRQLLALRAVFARHSSALYSVSGVDRLRRHARESRDIMYKTHMSLGLREGMDYFFSKVNEDLAEADGIIREIRSMMNAMYLSFSSEHGLNLGSPVHYSLENFRAEVARIEKAHQRQFGMTKLVTTEKYAVMRRFFESVAVSVREAYRVTGVEIQSWLRSVMSPIEKQIAEHQIQLKRRMDSVKRVLDANESLEDRINEISSREESARAELDAASEAMQEVFILLEAEPARLGVAQPEPA